MSDIREVVITINGESDGLGSSNGKLTLGEKEHKDNSYINKIQKWVNNPIGASIDAIGNNIEDTIGAYAVTKLANASVNIVKSNVNFFKSHVGRLSGDVNVARTVEQIDSALQVAGSLGSIASGIVAGSIFGPVGMVVGGAVATLSQAQNYIQQGLQFSYSIQDDNRSVLFLKNRAGSQMTNWSR